VPCKHLAAVCYVLAEAFDDDPFGILAWRGKGREDLLAALRGLSGSARPGGGGQSVRRIGPPAGPRTAGRLPEAGEAADPPLAESLAGFWSSGLSPARLRALPPAAAAPADLVLRGFEPPAIEVQGQDLATLLTPAYLLMASEGPPAAD